MAAMNPDAAVTREEFERTVEALRAELKAVSSSRPAPGSADWENPRDVFVHKDEFRLFKWFGGLALAAMLSGFGLLYQELVEQRAAMERQISGLRAEMNVGFSAVTSDVDAKFTALQRDIVDVRERLVRVETLLNMEVRDDPAGAPPAGPPTGPPTGT